MNMLNYLTCGQAAKKLHISISTLKRWVNDPCLKLHDLRNQNGWRLFSADQMDVLQRFKRELKNSGKRFKEETLSPVCTESEDQA
jgi:DNA-binding transcriptional MerR regulator